MRSKLEERIRKSQSAKKLDAEHPKVVNPEEVKAATAKIESELGIVLHSSWSEKQVVQAKSSVVSLLIIEVTQRLSNPFATIEDHREEAQSPWQTLGV